MNEYLLYAAIAGAGIFVCLFIPGLQIVAQAIIKLVIDFFVEVFKHKGSFIVWFIKTMMNDHAKVITHALQSRDAIDPTQKIRRASEGYED